MTGNDPNELARIRAQLREIVHNEPNTTTVDAAGVINTAYSSPSGAANLVMINDGTHQYTQAVGDTDRSFSIEKNLDEEEEEKNNKFIKIHRLIMSKLVFYGIIFFLLSCTLFLFAYSSPYWVESYNVTQNTFIRVGLWEICFNGHRLWKDDVQELLIGCHWQLSGYMFRFRSWMWPEWFRAVQGLATLALILIILAMILLSLSTFMENGNSFTLLFSGSIATLLSGLCMFTAVVIFGIRGDDRSWMPRPEFNYYSWSYAFAVISSIFSFISGTLLLIESIMLRRKKQSHNNVIMSNY
ncbi:hypothetical protein SNEBB_000768 [Seison nebaliae]|nr:hypothetical protein SNEBB_000768 [Seison nebaliae]